MCFNKSMSLNLGFGPFPGGIKDHSYTNYYKPEDPNKKKKQLIFGGVVLFIFLSVLSLVITTREDPAKAALIKLAAIQAETIGVSDKFYKQLGTAEMRRNDAEMRAITLTNNFKLGTELRRMYKVRSVPGSARKAVHDEAVYARLEEARQLTRLDQVYAEEMAKQLTKHVQQAAIAQALLKDTATKQVLTDISTQATNMRKRFEPPGEATIQ